MRPIVGTSFQGNGKTNIQNYNYNSETFAEFWRSYITDIPYIYNTDDSF